MKQEVAMSGLQSPIQIALVVRDARQTASLLSDLLGIGPWAFEDWPPDRPNFVSFADGQPAQWRKLLAFAEWGSIELELIQPLEGDTHYSRTLEQRGEGLHHVLFEVEDLDGTVASLAHQGFDVVLEATSRLPGARWVLVDTTEALGFALELRNRTPGAAEVDHKPALKET